MNNRLETALDTIVEYGDTIPMAMEKLESTDIRQKSQKDFVTAIDVQIETYISQAIHTAFPEDAIFGEEGTNTSGKSPYEWIIDPIDGTNNFMRGLPWVGLHIALLKHGAIESGVVYQPFEKTLFYAQRGSGAFRRQIDQRTPTRISISDRSITQSLLIFESAIALGRKRSMAMFQDFIPLVNQIRMPGVAAYEWMFLASGVADLLVYDQPKAVDITPGTIIIEEAGGIVTDFEGNPWSRSMNGVLVGNRQNHKEALSIVRKYAKSNH